ncbi:hypothetical protein YC2023_118388 [Brassica napus]
MKNLSPLDCNENKSLLSQIKHNTRLALLLRLRLCVCLSCSSLPLQVVRPIGQRFLTSNAMVPKLAEKTDNANSPRYIEFVIDGTLLAPSNPWAIKKDTWIHSRYISNLIISGADTHDGQGQVSWPLNDCHKNPSCPKLARYTTS